MSAACKSGPSSGEVFAINGLVEALGWDAAVIPTDLWFTVEGHWHPVTGDEPDRHRPEGWREVVRAGRSRVGDPLWFLDVARPVDEFMTDLASLLEDIARVAAEPGKGRHLLRIAIPVLGTGRGGHGATRGRMIDDLLDVVQRVVERAQVDIVIVARDRADFAALQAARRARSSLAENPDVSSLAEHARGGDLALFLGAGVSIPAGLPSWESLVGLIGEAHGIDLDGLPDVLDRAELLRNRLGDSLGDAVDELIRPVTHHSLAHAQLASLNCRQAVTTNFDTLYELAARNADHSVTVMPWHRPHGDGSWLLKLHGDIAHPGDIVLARRDFTRFAADRGPAGAMLQSLMMSRHLLVVGASMTDANVLRLAHEVIHFRRAHGLTEPIGTVLTLRPEPGQRRLWKGELDWISTGPKGTSNEDAGRRLEIFLDQLSMFAVTDSSYLLDERYATLLEDDQQRLASDLRTLHARIAALVDGRHRRAWDGVRGFLHDHGSRADG